MGRAGCFPRPSSGGSVSVDRATGCARMASAAVRQCGGQVNGSRPCGSATPNSRLAIAVPPLVPGYQASRIAPNVFRSPPQVQGPAAEKHEHNRGPCGGDSLEELLLLAGSSNEDRDAFSPIWSCCSPRTAMTTSAAAAIRTASSSAASGSNSSGALGLPSPNISNIEGRCAWVRRRRARTSRN